MRWCQWGVLFLLSAKFMVAVRPAQTQTHLDTFESTASEDHSARVAGSCIRQTVGMKCNKRVKNPDKPRKMMTVYGTCQCEPMKGDEGCECVV